MAAVTVVHIPPGPPSDDEPLFLLANDPFVLGYPCMPWLLHPSAGATPARASVPHFIAVRVFLVRNTIGTDAASTTAAATRSSITLLFNAAAWSRWFSELAASGLLNGAPFQRVRDSDRALLALTVSNPAALAILAADYARFDPFDVPGTAAVRAVGRRGQRNYVAAIPAGAPTPGPPDLGFINLASVALLQLPNSPTPLLSLCRLVGALGPCSTHASRANVTSSVRIVATVLRARVAKSAGLDTSAPITPANDALLASDLAGAVHAAFQALSSVFALCNLSESGLRSELRDAFAFLHGSASERESVIIRRLTFVDDRHARLYCARSPSAFKAFGLPPSVRKATFGRLALHASLRDVWLTGAGEMAWFDHVTMPWLKPKHWPPRFSHWAAHSLMESSTARGSHRTAGPFEVPENSTFSEDASDQIASAEKRS